MSFSYLTDTFNLAVSTDGVNFTAPLAFLGSTATNTGVSRSYFYNGSGPFQTNLAVLPIDLSSFGVAAGGNIVAARITGSPEADIIRVAGFTPAAATPVPEPGTMLLVGTGVVAVARRYRRK